MDMLVRVLGSALRFGLIQLLVYFILLMFVIGNKCCGHSRINDQFTDAVVFLGLLGMAFTQGYISTRCLQKGKKIAGYTGLVLNLVTLFFIFQLGAAVLDLDHYYLDFSRPAWEANHSTVIARSIIKDRLLQGLNREETIGLLGTADDTSSINHLTYYTNEGFRLHITFKNGHVSRCDLFYDD